MALRLPDPVGNGHFRTLLSWEHRAYAAHLMRLSSTDRHLRFMGGVSDTFLAKHARRACMSRRTKIIGWFHLGRLRGAVEVNWCAGHPAEAAFSVEPMHRRQGIGSFLMKRALRAARNRSVKELMIMTEADNIPMRRLAARFGARFIIEGREIEAVVQTKSATVTSVFQEVMEEQWGFASTVPQLLSPRALLAAASGSGWAAKTP